MSEEELLSVDDLPLGWAMSTVRDVVDVLQYGTSTKADSDEKVGVPVLRMGNIQDGRLDLSDLKFVPRSREINGVRLRQWDIIFNRTNSPELVGKSAVIDVDKEMVFASYLIRLRTRPQIGDPRYLCSWINSAWGREWARRVRTDGVSQSNINGSKLAEMPLPLAPLPEQHRIVEQVEALFAQVNKAKDRLDRVKQILTRFRQAVLAAACSGKLTEDWRHLHPDVPSGAASVAVQLARRRHAWEGWKQASPSRRRERYVEPVVSDRTLPEDLPSTWAWIRLGLLGDDPLAAVQTGPFGAMLHRDEFVPSGVPVIAVGNLTGLGFTTDDLYYVTAKKAAQLERFNVNAGDLLFARSGATLGKVCVAPDLVRDWRMTGHILRGRLHEAVIRPHLAAFALWGSPCVVEQVSESTRGVTRPGYNTELLESIHLPLPPLAEQDEIIRRVDGMFALADTIDRRLGAATARAERLPQSILSKAFRGELVSTEAELARAEGRSYESAEDLLKRVREASETVAKPKPGRRKVRAARR